MSNRLVSVSAGEVCSIDIAKHLGIFDAEYQYKADYNTVKRYDGTKEDKARTQKICTVNEFQKEAYPLCITSPNSQPGYTTKKEKGIPTDICQTYQCPPRFEDQGSSCKKPTEPRVIALSERNDQRWEDSFTISDYHLGNKFSKVENTNYAPCKQGKLPYFAKDPTDGERINWTSKDQPDKCVDKDVYFAGKYANTSEYCPIPMIKRYGFSLDNLYTSFMKAHKKESLTREEERYLENIYYDILESLLKTTSFNLENEKLMAACNKDIDEKDLNAVYDICEQIQKQPNAFAEKFMGETNVELQVREYLTKYACHNTFCPSKDVMNNAANIDKDPICFEDISEEMIQKSLEAYKKQMAQRNKELPPITSDKEKQTFKKTVTQYIAITILSVMFVILIIVIYTIFSDYWPYVRELILKKIWNLFVPSTVEVKTNTKAEIDKYISIKKQIKPIKNELGKLKKQLVIQNKTLDNIYY